MRKYTATALLCLVWLLAVDANAYQPGDQAFNMIFFAYDKATIMPCQQTKLTNQSECEKKCAEAQIVVEGHADTRGSAEYNKDLSMRRAQAVKAAFVKAGVSADRITCVAKGGTEPAILCHADTSHQLNRRVEVFLVNPGAQKSASETVAPPAGLATDVF